MKPLVLIAVIGLFFMILLSGCVSSAPYPTQKITITGKYEEKGLFNTPLYFIIDQDGDVAEVYTGSLASNKGSWDSMKTGTSYICDMTTGGTNGVYRITRIVAEVYNYEKP
jgi:hypothetical protein